MRTGKTGMGWTYSDDEARRILMETINPRDVVTNASDDIWMMFSATLLIGSHTENPEASNPSTVFFCDYASAGNTWTRANYYRAWFPVEYGNNE